jgi:hypothetical protein
MTSHLGAVPPAASGAPQVVIADTASSNVPVMLSRLEAKLDVALAHQGAKLDSHDATLDDHETRLRTVEARPTVSPRVLWATVASGVGVLAALFPILERFYT